MSRWIVVFRSPSSDGETDSHFVDVVSNGPLRAVRDALNEAPPPFDDWVLAEAIAWPAGIDDLNAAVAVVA